MNVALIIAGGKGERLNQDIPKQFIHVEDRPVIIYTLEAFQQHPSIDAIIVVCLEGWSEILCAYARQYSINKLRWVVPGGKIGHDSIHNGLVELKKHCADDDIIIIHDANRPMISQDIISDGIAVCAKFGSAVAVIPCTEVVFKSMDGNIGDEEIPRESLRRLQTPQIFSLGKLLWAHEEAERRGITNPVTSCSLMLALGEIIHFSQGSEKNIRLTTVEDIDIFRALLNISDHFGKKK